MIDSHCHLDYLDEPAAAADGLLGCVSVGTNVARNAATLALAESLPNVWAAVGVHPNEAGLALDPEVRRRVEEQSLHPRVVAIGETGFDTHWDRETLESQDRAFDWQAGLAARRDLPLILHVRDRQGGEDASLAALSALRRAGHRRGVLHCFNGHDGLLTAALELGWYVSFAGNLTYPSARRLREAAAEVPEDRLLIETDSPFLAPVPHRGKENRPGFVAHTLAALAAARGAAVDHLERVTDDNAVRFYRLPLRAPS